MSFNIAVVYGSVRSARQGIKAAKFVCKQLESKGHNVSLIDPLEYVFPMLDKRYFEFEPGKAPDAIEKVAQIFEKADGFVFVTGEYNHSIPPALLNILDHYTSQYTKKPAGIVSYSGGPFGGIRSAVHMRVVAGQLGMVTIPTMFPVSAVQDSFDEQGNAIDKAYEKRIQDFLDEFGWYVSVLGEARKKA